LALDRKALWKTRSILWKTLGRTCGKPTQMQSNRGGEHGFLHLFSYSVRTYLKDIFTIRLTTKEAEKRLNLGDQNWET
jgi:hypothetical protein